MRVTFDEGKELYVVDDEPGAPRFTQIEGAFGWLDSSGKGHAAYHWFVTAGLTEGKKVVFLEEHYGPLHFVATEAIEAKDRCLIRRIHADYEQRQLCMDLMSDNYDGLTHYASEGRDLLNRVQYLHKTEHWKHFRNRGNTAALVPLITEEKINVQAGFDRLVQEISKENTTFRRVFILPTLVKLVLKEALDHPGVRAMVWAHNALLRSQLTAKQVKPKPAVYGNVRR